MTQSLKVSDYLKIIAQRWWIVLLITIVFTGASFMVSLYALTPMYEAKGEVLVYTPAEEQVVQTLGYQKKLEYKEEVRLPLDDIEKNLRMMASYSDLITSQHMMGVLHKELDKQGVSFKGIAEPKSYLADKIQVDVKEDSQMMTITVQDSDKDRAALMTDELMQLFEDDMKKLLQYENVRVISNATVHPDPVSPNLYLNSAIAFTAGLLISLLIVFAIGPVRRKRNV